VLLNGLRALYKNATAIFKSTEQAKAAAIVYQRKENLLAVLPTGGGKSLLYQLSISMEENLTTIVILPFVVLVEQVEAQCIQLGFRYKVWTDDDLDDELPQVLIVAVEHAIKREFQDLCIQFASSGRLARFVIDECHTLVTHKDFREAVRRVGATIRCVNVPVLILTATIPPEMEDEVRVNFGCSQWRVIRKIEDRKELEYQVLDVSEKAKTKMDYDRLFAQTVEELTDKFGPRDRGIIYCLETKWAEKLAEHLNKTIYKRFCLSYHAQMTKEDRTDALNDWRQGRVIWLVATSALGAGLDYGAVRAIVHHIQGKSLIDFVQETGRAGRDGSHALALTIYWNRMDEQLEWIPEHQRKAMTDWIHCQDCRKKLLSIAMHGSGENCLVQAEGRLCDKCINVVENKPVAVIKPPIIQKRRREVDTMEVTEAVLVKRMLNDLKGICSYCWLFSIPDGHKHELFRCRYVEVFENETNEKKHGWEMSFVSKYSTQHEEL